MKENLLKKQKSVIVIILAIIVIFLFCLLESVLSETGTNVERIENGDIVYLFFSVIMAIVRVVFRIAFVLSVIILFLKLWTWFLPKASN